MSIAQLIDRIPKADIHLHLDGSVRPETILDLAQEQGIDLGTDDKDELIARVMPDENCESLEEYLQAFGITCSVMGTADALYRVAYELVEDCANDQHTYLEVRWATRVLPLGLTPQQMVEAVWSGLRDAGEKYNVVARQILCGMRHEDPKYGIENTLIATMYKYLVVGTSESREAYTPYYHTITPDSMN